MKTVVQKMIAVGAGLFLTTNAAVYGTQILYSNASTDTGSSLNFVNSTTIGDEIEMAGAASSYTLTSFKFEYYSPNASFSGDVQMDILLYANDGNIGSPNGNGFENTPSTILYNSGSFALETPTQYGYGHYATLTISSLSVTVPQDFTLAFEVTGLAGGDTAGLELFSSPTVGQNNGDYWYHVDNDNNGWQLNGLAGTETGFGAEFEGISAVPEPSAYGAIAGAWLLALCSLRVWRQRRRNV